MASFELPDMPATRMSPQLLMGVSSPLWSYFGAAAAGGVAYWWMTRWTQPVNLEAMFGAARSRPMLALVPPPAIEAAEAVAEATETVAERAAETIEDVVEAAPEPVFEPVGGEAAPISPLVEAAPEIEPIIEPEAAPDSFAETAAAPLLDAAPEPILEEPAPFLGEPAPEVAPKPRGKKAPVPPVEPEA